MSRPNTWFISSYTRCGFNGMASKCDFRSMEFLRCRQAAAHAPRSGSRPSAFMARATAMNACNAAFASDTMPKSGPNTRPICVGSMSTCTKVRPFVYTSTEPVCRLAQRLPMPSTKSLSRNVALP